MSGHGALLLRCDIWKGIAASRTVPVFQTLIQALKKRRQERLAVVALSHLSDHQLNDIGLTRGSLDRAVRYGVAA